MKNSTHRSLTREELYAFDTSGMLLEPALLTRDRCTEILQTLDPLWSSSAKEPIQRIDDIAHLPGLTDIAAEIAYRSGIYDTINQPMRVIESYALRRGSGSAQPLHNGRSNLNMSSGLPHNYRAMWREHTYHDGLLYCMMVKALVYLTDVASVEDGPFVIVEGSHKSNYPYPVPRPDMAAGVGLEDTGARPVFTATGDLVLLNEAATHGSLSRTTDGGYRTLLAFSYAPSFVSDYANLEKVGDLDYTGFLE